MYNCNKPAFIEKLNLKNVVNYEAGSTISTAAAVDSGSPVLRVTNERGISTETPRRKLCNALRMCYEHPEHLGSEFVPV